MSDQAGAVVRIEREIARIKATSWDDAANPDPAQFNPFVSHAFLKALEDSACVGPGTGWIPHHLVLTDRSGDVTAAAPAYVKTHSQGEYVFDYGWADAYERVGGRYYPKLQIAVPFTPVPGPRLLVRPGNDALHNEEVLAAAAAQFADQSNWSSVHVTFLEREAAERLATRDYLVRSGQQFHWQNQDYATFDDFLGSFASRKRKGVRRERADAVANVEIERIQGGDLKELHWDSLFTFYMDTGSRKWGRPYLNRTFFSLLGETMAERCLLVLAKRNGRYIAGALHMVGGDCLYGRYWGAIEHHPFLHFELCYYQAIEYAISHKLARVEAGAQGEHKIARGYLPVETYSAHWIADPHLKRAVQRFLIEERAAVKDANLELAELGPFRKG